MDIHDFVRGYLYPFLYDVIRAAGGDDNAVSSAYYFFVGLFDNDITGLSEPLAFGPIAVWFMLKHALSYVAPAVQTASDFVNNIIAPSWNAVIGDLNYLITWLDNAGGYIWRIAVNVWNYLAAAWLYAWRFAQWLYDNGAWFLYAIISNPASVFYNYVWPLIQSFFQPYAGYIQWLISLWNVGAGFLLSFLHDPTGFVVNLARAVFNDLSRPFLPLLDILAWWERQGANVLVRFVNDPTKFILDLLAPVFIAWVLDLIDQHWG